MTTAVSTVLARILTLCLVIVRPVSAYASLGLQDIPVTVLLVLTAVTRLCQIVIKIQWEYSVSAKMDIQIRSITV